MSTQQTRILIAICGILGTILLGLYFGVGFSVGLAQLPPDTTATQVVSIGKEYRNLWFLGTWLQATGSLLSVIFFLALVQKAGRVASLAGLITILGSAVLLLLYCRFFRRVTTSDWPRHRARRGGPDRARSIRRGRGNCPRRNRRRTCAR